METKHSLHKTKNKKHSTPLFKEVRKMQDARTQLVNCKIFLLLPRSGLLLEPETGKSLAKLCPMVDASQRKAQEHKIWEQGNSPGFPPFSGLGTQMCWLLKYSKRKLLGSKSSCIPSKRTTYTVEASCHGKCMCCQSYEHRKPYEFTMKVLPFQGEHKDLAV